MDERLSRRRVLASLAAVTTGAIAGCASAPSEESNQTPATTPNPLETPRPIETPPPVDDARFGEVYEETIRSVAMVTAIGPTGPIGQGSGFVYGADTVVTNEHVIRGGTHLELQFADNEWATGSVIGRDPHSDLAVIEVDALPPETPRLPPADHRPTVGQEVLAIGSPFGLEASVSSGIVSGVGRNLPTGDGFSIPDTIQTDAGINPGNSGGPLVTMQGSYLGIIIARQRGEDTVGFAVSWRLAERVIPSLLETGEYHHAFLGIYTYPVTPAVAEANDLEEVRGVMVVDTIPDGPSAGHLYGSDRTETIRGEEVPVGGDVIVGFDGHPIETSEALSTFLALHTSPDDELSVSILREGQQRTESVTLGTRPDP